MNKRRSWCRSNSAWIRLGPSLRSSRRTKIRSRRGNGKERKRRTKKGSGVFPQELLARMTFLPESHRDPLPPPCLRLRRRMRTGQSLSRQDSRPFSPPRRHRGMRFRPARSHPALCYFFFRLFALRIVGLRRTRLFNNGAMSAQISGLSRALANSCTWVRTRRTSNRGLARVTA